MPKCPCVNCTCGDACQCKPGEPGCDPCGEFQRQKKAEAAGGGCCAKKADAPQDASPRLATRQLGKTDLRISVVSLGGVGIGAKGAAELYGGVTDEEAIATVHRAIERGINFIDTSPLYRESERRIGLALEALPAAQREGLLVGSKVGDECPPYSDNGGHSPFSYKGVMASVAHSLKLLRVVKRLDTVLLHDPTMAEVDEFLAAGSGLEAIRELQRQGVVGYFGIGCVEHEVHSAMLQRADAAIVLSVNDFNLLRRYGEHRRASHRSRAPRSTASLCAGTARVARGWRRPSAARAS